MDKRTKEVIEAGLNAESAAMKELEKVYKAALDAINERIRLLQTGEITQSTIYHIEYQKTLKAQISAILDKLQADEYTSLEKYLTDNYNIGFAGSAYAMHGQGVPVLMPIDKNAVYKAIVTDTKLTHPLYKEIGLDMAKLKKTVTHEISRGIASGLSYKDMARNIQAAAKIPENRAKAIARTDGHRVLEASAEDARQLAKARGADVVKQWDATMDGNTRDTHRQLDGQIRETNEPFTIGSKSAMYPGSFGIPEEDCNCRCIATTRARWELDEDELNILKERAAFFGLDKTKDFDEFKEKYLKAVENPEAVTPIKTQKPLENKGNSDKINPDTKGAGSEGVTHIANLNASLIDRKWPGANAKVILTNERIAHIIEGHKEDYEAYGGFIRYAIEKPRVILVDAKNENTALYIGEAKDTNITVVVKIAFLNDAQHTDSSVITMYRCGEKRLRRLIKNNEVLYKRE